MITCYYKICTRYLMHWILYHNIRRKETMKKYKINRYFTYEGEKIWIHADNETDFAVKKALKMKELEAGNTVSSSNMLFSVWAKRCIDIYKNSNSVERDIRSVKLYLNPVLGKRQLSKIKPIDCQQVLTRMAEKDYSKYTIHYANNLMKFIFDKAQMNDLIPKNPCVGIVEPDGGKDGRRSFTDEEEKAFLEVIKNPRFKVFALMYYCGCRPEEARKAVGSDIQSVSGYNTLHIRGTKSENADRFVPIPPELYEMIKDTPKDNPIAPTEAGSRHKKSSWDRCWSSLRRAMNIKMGCKVYRNQLMPPFPLAEDLVPYCIRHTYCTNLQKKGVDIRTAQYLMGHSDIKLTANIYTHTGIHNAIEAAEILCKGAT